MRYVRQLYRLGRAALVSFELAEAVYGRVHIAQVPARGGYQDGRQGLLERINHSVTATAKYIYMFRCLLQR